MRGMIAPLTGRLFVELHVRIISALYAQASRLCRKSSATPKGAAQDQGRFSPPEGGCFYGNAIVRGFG
jgi:hypothetical protein